MSNSLVKASDVAGITNQDELADILGYRPETGSLPWPRLTINSDGEDDEGRRLPLGAYKIAHPEHGILYCKTALFRPMVIVYQYSVYDSETNNYSSRSVFFKDWRDDIIDTDGGYKCGKITGRAKENLSDTEKDKQRGIKCQRYAFGTVDMIDATTVYGDTFTIEGFPCLWRHGGVNFMVIGEFLDTWKKGNKVPWSHKLGLGTKRVKEGGNTFYAVTAEQAPGPEMSKLSTEEFNLASEFMSYIATENDEVARLHNKARAIEPEVVDVVASITEETLNDRLDDL